MAKVQGLDRLKAKIMRLAPETKKEMLAALNKGADEMVAMAKRLVPVDDGVLRDSIRKEPGRHELAVTVQAGGEEAFYARWQEFGTPTQPAQAFFFPSYRSLRDRARRRNRTAAGKAAKKVAGNGK